MTDEAFAELLSKVRAGDEAACARLVDEYAPEIRRVVRVRLREPLLRSTVDTADVCQSVLMDFFVRAKLGQYELDSPRDLVKLLVTMARHKVLNEVRRPAVRKAARQQAAGETVDWLVRVPDGGDSPSSLVSGDELLAKARDLLNADERQLADFRRQGRDWAEIARLTGDTPEAARKRLARAAERILTELGFRQVSS